jgi:hypothetical protein
MLVLSEYASIYLLARQNPLIGERAAENVPDKDVTTLILISLVFAWLGWFGAVAATVWDGHSPDHPDYVTPGQHDVPAQKRLDSDPVIQLAQR